MAAVASPEAHKLSAWADSLGSTGAFLCAIHCAAWPFALAILPVLELSLFGSENFERGFVLCAAILGSASLGWSCRRHRGWRPFAWLIPGLIILGVGVATPALHESLVLHAITMTAGGTLVSLAHVINLRMMKRIAEIDCCAE